MNVGIYYGTILKISAFLCACCLLVGCSDKDPLTGKRESVILSDDILEKLHTTDANPVLVENEYENQEFPQRFVTHTHCYLPLKFSISPSNIWSAPLDYESSKAIRMVSSPVVADGKVFCIDAAGVVYAFNQKDGSRLWRTSLCLVGKDGQIGGAIAYDNGKVIVTSDFAECFSLDAKTGRINWRTKLSAPCKGDGITVYEGKVFLSCSNSTLHVLNIDTGRAVWSHSGTITDNSYMGSASVAIDEGMVFVAYQSGEIYALLLETGIPIWDSMFHRVSLTNSSRAFSHPRACPVVKNGIVYFVASNEQVVAFDTKTGKRLWMSTYGGLQTPTVSGNSIFVFTERAKLVCLNRFTGVVRWISELDREAKNNGNWYGQILVKDHIAMLSPEGKLMFVSVYDGKIKKTIDLTWDEISINPVIAKSVMYILTDNGKLLAYK
jgi:outer membrane protein assembly factor BamB